MQDKNARREKSGGTILGAVLRQRGHGPQQKVWLPNGNFTCKFYSTVSCNQGNQGGLLKSQNVIPLYWHTYPPGIMGWVTHQLPILEIKTAPVYNKPKYSIIMIHPLENAGGGQKM